MVSSQATKILFLKTPSPLYLAVLARHGMPRQEDTTKSDCQRANLLTDHQRKYHFLYMSRCGECSSGQQHNNDVCFWKTFNLNLIGKIEILKRRVIIEIEIWLRKRTDTSWLHLLWKWVWIIHVNMNERDRPSKKAQVIIQYKVIYELLKYVWKLKTIVIFHSFIFDLHCDIVYLLL